MEMENYTDKQLREIFHLLFLERLLKLSNPAFYVLKGGVNLRFFYNSPRYSEDMDIDVLGGAVETLKKNVYKILEDASFRRVLRTCGIEGLRLSDPLKAKQTETTQRFKLRIVTLNGEEFPTKVEFSRRDSNKKSQADIRLETINPDVVKPYRRLAFSCQHYLSDPLVNQKLHALAERAVPQARDPFDLFILYSGGYIPDDFKLLLNKKERNDALQNLASLSYADYLGQVVEYLDQEQIIRYKSKEVWDQICQIVISLIQSNKK